MILAATLFSATAKASVTNTVNATSIVAAGQGSVTPPLNMIRPGLTLRVRAEGYYSTKASVPGTLTLLLKIGSVTVVTTAAITLTVSLVNLRWTLDATITVVADGATGSVWAQGGFNAQILSNGPLQCFPMINTALKSIDWTTNTRLIDATAQFSVSGTNDLECTNLDIQTSN